MLTLVEAAKLALNNGETLRAGVISLFARSSPILTALPFMPVAGGAYRYNREATLPGIGFRGVNEGFTPSTGVINPEVETLAIAGGDLDVDRFIVETQGPQARAVHEAMKVKALAQQWHYTFLKGDSATNPKEFDGLQVRLGGNQLIENGATAGGDPLSLAKLDELIDAVDGDNKALIMSQAMRRKLTQAARGDGTTATPVGGFIVQQFEELGKQVQSYNGLPILEADANDIAANYKPLAFDEAGGGGGTTSTSIYAVSFGDGMLHGIDNGGMSVRDLGEINEKPVFRTRCEWYSALALPHPRGAGRLRGISDATPVK